jgi:hypothetical protein
MTPREHQAWEAKCREMADQLNLDQAVRAMGDVDRAKLCVEKMDQARQLLNEARLLMTLNIPADERPNDEV